MINHCDDPRTEDLCDHSATEEAAGRFVVRLEEGGLDNVVGLPVALALELLARAGALVPGSTGGYPSRPFEPGPRHPDDAREP